MQISSSNSSFLQTVQLIYQQHGAAGFFRGFNSIALRDSPFMIILFSSYEGWKSLMAAEHTPFWCRIVYGGASGFLAGFLTTPLDVIKTQIMTSPLRFAPPSYTTSHHIPSSFSTVSSTARAHSSQVPGLSTGAFSVAANLYRTHGLKVFLRGSLSRSSWWFCVCSIFFPVYETCKLNFSTAL